MRWIDIKQSKGFYYETINNIIKPSMISGDVILKLIRVDKTFRIYGYRIDNDFYMIWFDSNHKLT